MLSLWSLHVEVPRIPSATLPPESGDVRVIAYGGIKQTTLGSLHLLLLWLLCVGARSRHSAMPGLLRMGTR